MPAHGNGPGLAARQSTMLSTLRVCVRETRDFDMPPTSSIRVAEALELARQRFADGRLVAVVELLEPIDRQDLPATQVASIDHLQCVASFRLGQLSDSLRCAQSFLTRVDSGIESEVEQRFSVLAVAVVAAGELALYEQSLQYLAELLTLSARLGDLSHYVRARGTAASAFLLLGDLWAAQRVLNALSGEFDRAHDEQRLETTMRCNHASLCLQLVRMAREADDAEAATQALQEAAVSVRRATSRASELQDLRLVIFVRLHEVELSMLQGHLEQAEQHLAHALHDAQSAGLNAHWRHMQLLEAELLLMRGTADRALPILEGLVAAEHAGNELSTRIRLHDLQCRCLSALGHHAAALSARQAHDKLQAARAFRQGRAQSTLMRTRLEMEHLFLRRSDGKAFGAGAVGPACLGETVVPSSVGQAPMSRAIRRPRRKPG
jgi:tetratricopeptide (TPR) repeat protein